MFADLPLGIEPLSSHPTLLNSMAHPFRLLALLVLLPLVAAVGTTLAQPGAFAAGVRGGFYLDDGAPAVGIIALVPLTDRILLEPGIEVELYDSRTKRYVFDICGRMNFPIRNPSVIPYAELGLGYEDERYDDGINRASRGNVRVNAVGGITLNAMSKLQFLGAIRVFGAFRTEFATDVVLQAGALYWF